MIKTTLNGFDRKEVTLKAQGQITAGSLVTLSDAGAAKAVVENGTFVGVCSEVRNRYASVIIRGHCVVPYSGTSPLCGFVKLVTTSDGKVTKDEDFGREYLVVGVDSKNSTLEIIL